MTFALYLIVAFLLLLAFYGRKAVVGFAKEAKDTVKEITKKDPIGQAKADLKSALENLATLKTHTLTLEKSNDKMSKQKEEWTEVAKAAKRAGNMDHAKTAFDMIQELELNKEEAEKDISANNSLYLKLNSQITKLETRIEKALSSNARNASRKSSNELRRNIAKDAVLGEGLETILTEDTDDSVELESEAYEFIAEGRESEDLRSTYNSKDTADFDKFLDTL